MKVRMRTAAWIVAAGVWGGALSGTQAQTVHYVDAAAIGGMNTGTNWADAFIDLQSALGVAAGGHQVWVAKGTYTPGVNPQDSFVVPRDVSIYGGFESGMAALEDRDPWTFHTILSGDLNGDDTPNFGNRADNAYHVVRSSALTPYVNVRVDGFVIRGGHAHFNDPDPHFDQFGGGIFMDTCTGFTLANCVVTDNSALGSGGIFFRRTTAEIIDCVFSGNRATGDTSDYGSGAIGGSGNNTATHVVNVRRSYFTGNHSSSHGGVSYDLWALWPLNYYNCLMAGNNSGSIGGALYHRNGTNEVWNCTIAGNAPNGVYVQGTTNAYYYNTIIWSNAIPEVDTGGVGNLTPSHSDINRAVYAGVRGNIQADPVWTAGISSTWTEAGAFSPATGQTRLRRAAAGWTADAFQGLTVAPDITTNLQFLISSNSTTDIYVWGDASMLAGGGDTFRIWDYQLDTGSPCIDTGTDTGAPAEDIRGELRPKGAATDMGAYESTATGSVLGVIYVRANAAGLNNGSSWEHAYTNLQSALAVASSEANHQIWVGAGTYRPGSDPADTFTLVSRVPMYGGFAGTESSPTQRQIGANPTILCGDLLGNDTANFGNRADNARNVVVEFYTRNVRLDGFVIRGGHNTGDAFLPEGQGAGLFSEGASTNFVIANCVFADNSATAGGALFIKQPNPAALVTVVNTVFSGNRATESDNNRGGGAISGQSGGGGVGTLLVDRCVFVGNRAPNSIGGAYASADGSTALNVRFVNALVAGNQSGYDGGGGPQGGGLFLRGAPAFTVQNSTLAHNDPFGITSKGATPLVRNGIVWGNTSAALLILDQSVTVQFTDIDAAGYAGFNGNIQQDPEWVTGADAVIGTVVYTPATGQSTLSVVGVPWAAGAFVNRSVNPNLTQPLQFWIVTNTVNTLTVWGDAQAVASAGQSLRVYDYRLQGTSPCINAGSIQGAPALDLDGALRPVDGIMDMGAYEFGGSALFPDGMAFVKADATGANNGTSWSDAFTDLQDALAIAPGGRDIWVAAGTYTPGASVSDAFVLKANVGVYGGFAGTETQRTERNWSLNPTYLSGDLAGNDGNENLAMGATNRADNARHVVIGVDFATLDGFVIVGGHATALSDVDPDWYGGGIHINGTSPTIRHCTFVDNYAAAGGAIAILGAGSAPLIENCVFSANWAGAGGGAYSQGAPTFRRCQFAGSEVMNSGAALWFQGATQPLVENCVFSGNYSQFDGAIRVDGAAGSNTVRIVNGTFTGNEGEFNGALFIRRAAQPEVVNSILWGNRATALGGSNEIGIDTVFPGSVVVSHSDVAGGYVGVGNINANPAFNAAITGTLSAVGAYNPATRQTQLTASGAAWPLNQWAGMVVNPNTNQWKRFAVVSNTSTSLTVWGNAALVSAPGAPYLINNLDLSLASPCLDLANGAAAPARDYLGRPRPSGPGFDMGAYEYQTLPGLGMQLLVW